MPGPWRWYCRLCGEEGGFDTPGERDLAAAAHLTDTVCGRGRIVERVEYGHLIHVWTWG